MVSNNQVTSFSEKILLNKNFLDFICPTTPDKQIIHQTGTSIFRTLDNLTLKRFDHDVKPVNTFTRITNPVREVGRVMVIAVVSLTASPLGLLCYGSLAAGHLIHYSVGNFKKGSDLQAKKWAVIAQYTSATIKDLTCFVTGLVASSILGLGALYLYIGSAILVLAPASATKFAAIGICFGLSSAYGHFSRCFGGFDPSMHIARLIGNWHSEVGLYNVLELRRKFGFVDQDGELLKFSTDDHVSYPVSPNNKNFATLWDLNTETELDLIDLVKRTNKILKEHNIAEIQFKYAFNGNEIAEHLEKTISSQLKPKFQKIIQDFKIMDYRMQNLRELVQNTVIFSKNSTIFDLFNTDKLNNPKAYISYKEYKDYFSARLALEEFYKSLDVEAKEPLEQEPAGLFNTFLYRLSVSKWKVLNEETPMEKYELLGLNKDFSSNELTKAFKKIRNALHPDKNYGNEKQATMLFNLLDDIIIELENDLKQR